MSTAGALTTAGQNGYFWYLSQTSIPTSNDRGSTIKKRERKNPMSHSCLSAVRTRRTGTLTLITALLTLSSAPTYPGAQEYGGHMHRAASQCPRWGRGHDCVSTIL